MESFRPHFDRPSLFWPACRAHPSGRLGSNLATVHHRRKHVEVTSAPGVPWPAPSACVSQLKAQTVVTWCAAVSQETHLASLSSLPTFLHKPGLDFQSRKKNKTCSAPLALNERTFPLPFILQEAAGREGASCMPTVMPHFSKCEVCVGGWLHIYFLSNGAPALPPPRCLK